MKTQTTYVTIMTLLLVPLFLVHAETSVTAQVNATVTASPKVLPIKKDIQDARVEAKKEISNIKTDARADIRAIRTSTSSASTSAEIQADAALRIKAIQADIKLKLDTRKTALKAQVAAMKAEHKDEKQKKLDDAARVRVQNDLNSIYAKLNLKVTKLSRVDSEITRKIAMFSLRATTTPEAIITTLKTSQKNAQDLLLKARIDVEATRVTASAEVGTTTTKEVFRSLVTTAEISIKAAADAYRQVLVSVKTLVPAKLEASSTVSAKATLQQ